MLLDDCLSAVDSHTAKHIFREALTGPLMLNRTCILVTHNVALTVPESDHVVVLENGRISAQGRPNDVAATGALGDEFLKSQPASRAGSRAHSRVPSDHEVEDEDSNGTPNGKQEDKAKLSESKATGLSLIHI